MQFENSFEIPLPPAEAWPVLMDIRRIAPCLPGAELTEVVDERTYKGKISVRLGPVSLTFGGIVKFEVIDNENYRARVRAQGTDAKGRGGAQASSSFHVQPAEGGSKVLVRTDLTLSGSVAQYGRGAGIIEATAGHLMQQFSEALKRQLDAPSAISSAENSAAANSTVPNKQSLSASRPISGFSLILRVVWESFWKRLRWPRFAKK